MLTNNVNEDIVSIILNVESNTCEVRPRNFYDFFYLLFFFDLLFFF